MTGMSQTELQQHSLPGDIWMSLEGMVCDITDFVNVHPGGADLLLQLAGKDATEEFNMIHLRTLTGLAESLHLFRFLFQLI